MYRFPSTALGSQPKSLLTTSVLEELRGIYRTGLRVNMLVF
jgi:hypothetical protein